MDALEDMARLHEAEAAVLRAVAHLGTFHACELLERAVAKIRALDMPQLEPKPGLSKFKDSAAEPASPAVPLDDGAGAARSRSAIVLRLVGASRGVQQLELYEPVAKAMDELHEMKASKNRTASTIWMLVRDGQLTRDKASGALSLPR